MWVLFRHALSDCYYWIEDPTPEDYQGDGEVDEVTGIEEHEVEAFAQGIERPPGWLDPLVDYCEADKRFFAEFGSHRCGEFPRDDEEKAP